MPEKGEARRPEPEGWGLVEPVLRPQGLEQKVLGWENIQPEAPTGKLPGWVNVQAGPQSPALLGPVVLPESICCKEGRRAGPMTYPPSRSSEANVTWHLADPT